MTRRRRRSGAGQDRTAACDVATRRQQTNTSFLAVGSFLLSNAPGSFARNSLWQDLSPVDWLLRKMGENLYMQPATWLTSRELAEVAGPWNTRLQLR